jgi:hypothetical protein
MQHLGVDMQNQTQSVSFTSETLKNWLTAVMPLSDEMRIFMGLYPSGHHQAGRTTVILWPYKDGEPVKTPISIGKDGGGGGEEDDEGKTIEPPYNDGQGHP